MKKLVLLILIIPFILIAGCQQQPLCVDECSNNTCSGFVSNSCLRNTDGCMDKVEDGIVKGRCGVECLSDIDCKSDMKCTNYRCTDIEITEEKSSLDKQATKVSKAVCGNSMIEGDENCANCPEDVACKREESCILSECRSLEWQIDREASQKHDIYCKYSDLKNTGDNIAHNAVNSIESCKDPFGNEQDAKRLFDNDVKTFRGTWSCGSYNNPVSFPQFVAVELDKGYVINKVSVFQSNEKSDNWNVRKFHVEVSADSTNGKNGHWTLVGSGTLKNTYSFEHILRFTPISAKWVKLYIDSTYEEDKFAIAEIKVFEAEYICTDDPDFYTGLREAAPIDPKHARQN